MFHRIVIAFDGSPGARRALTVGLDLARELGAAVWVLSVEEYLPHYAATVGEVLEEKDERDRYFAALQAEATAMGRERELAVRTEIRAGQAARAITAFAEEERADLLVIGHSGHSEVWGRFMGSTADKISRHAPCSVLVVR